MNGNLAKKKVERHWKGKGCMACGPLKNANRI
jgi:hypothetical protein